MRGTPARCSCSGAIGIASRRSSGWTRRCAPSSRSRASSRSGQKRGAPPSSRSGKSELRPPVPDLVRGAVFSMSASGDVDPNDKQRTIWTLKAMRLMNIPIDPEALRAEALRRGGRRLAPITCGNSPRKLLRGEPSKGAARSPRPMPRRRRRGGRRPAPMHRLRIRASSSTGAQAAPPLARSRPCQVALPSRKFKRGPRTSPATAARRTPESRGGQPPPLGCL